MGNDFSDETPTVEIPHETLSQIAAQWREQIATSERPTVNIRPRRFVDAECVEVQA